MRESQIMLEVYADYKNLIWHRAIAHYRMLPAHLQKQVDLEDFVQEGYLFAAKRLNKYYTSSKSQRSTYLYSILNNFYKNVLAGLTNQARGAITVSIDTEFESTRLGVTRSIDEGIDAQKVARRFHELASVPLVCYLDTMLFNPKERAKVLLCTNTFKTHAKEFRELVKKTGLTINQYRIAIRVHQALKAQEE